MSPLQSDLLTAALSHGRLRIGGVDEPGAGPAFDVFNPATEELIATMAGATPEQARRAASEAQKAFRNGLGSTEDRSAALSSLADVLEAHTEEILALEVAEVGTPMSTARGLHVDTPVQLLRWLAQATLVDRTEHLGRVAGPPANEAVVLHRPIGVVAGITAYNYPMMFAVMKAGSALAAGCPTVLLPSPQAPLSTLLFAAYADEAGLPAGAISVLTGGIDVAQALIAAPEVAKVSFTGSVPAGTSVMRQAADGLRGVVLELGGKSAALLLPSADVAALADGIHRRYLRNAGQGCASPTRILLQESQFDAFAEASRAVYHAVRVGDPRNPEVLVGPVISAAHRDRVNAYIDGAIADGAEVVAEAELPDAERGWWVRPTLLAGLPNSAIVNQEEIFGPVATVQTYRTVDEAVDIANDTGYGLHTAVFGDVQQALELAPRMQSGLVTINGGGPVRTDAPNGGWKHSGIGRERGDAGIREFLEPVTVQWPV